MTVPRLDGQFDFVDLEEPMETQAGYTTNADHGDEARPGRLSLILPAPTDGALPLVSVTIDGTPVPAERRADERMERLQADTRAAFAWVEARRALYALTRTEFVLHIPPKATDPDLMLAEALRRGEAAEARVADLEAELNATTESLERYGHICNEAQRAAITWQLRYDGLREVMAAAEARVAALEEALRPLAALAGCFPAMLHEGAEITAGYRSLADPTVRVALTLGHVRAARRALDSPGGER